MTQETELEIDLDQDDTTNEQETSSTEIVLEEGDDNTSSQESKKNESNFKALYKSNKEKEKALAEKEALISEQSRELQEWRNLNPEYVSQNNGTDKTAEMQAEIFGLKNPESQEHLASVRAIAKEYGLPLDKAWKIVKADLPTGSKSSSDFDFKSAPVVVKRSIKDIKESEVGKLSEADQSKWRKYHLGID